MDMTRAMRRGRLIGACVALAVAGATLFWFQGSRVPAQPSVVVDHPAATVPARGNDNVGGSSASLAGNIDAAPPADADPRETAMQLEHELTSQIERALVSRDAAARETAFAFALPELIRLTPTGVIALVARQPAGVARDALRDDTARQWIQMDRDAAVEWLRSLPDADRSAGGMAAVRTLAASSPPEAIRVADELNIGRDDGSVDHILQLWAASEPDAARRWQTQRE
jgi:hypothetical protein